VQATPPCRAGKDATGYVLARGAGAGAHMSVGRDAPTQRLALRGNMRV